MRKISYGIPFFLIISMLIMGCGTKKGDKPGSTSEILITSAAGEKQAKQANVAFKEGHATGNVVSVFPDELKQEMQGIGTSFTESSAFVLAHLEETKRHEVMQSIWGESGADFAMARTHIGACDFCVKGRYSYADSPEDQKLEHFSIDEDKVGFLQAEYNGIKTENYDLLPMIKEAMSIKQQQTDKRLKIVASAWTAPYWMKDIQDWYIPGSEENNWQGSGGSLKKGYETIYADYLVKYIKAYQAEGIDIWGLTPVNEPHGNNGQWESMHFSPQTQNEFIKNYLGPKLLENGYEGLKLLIYDQNRDGIEDWTDEILADSETSSYVYGTAVHWYESTYKVYEDIFERVHKKYPDKAIIHTEGCIDDLGKPAPGGVTDPEGYQEENWFGNDAFWWNKTATDWAYSVTWQGVKVEDHPIYVPVHRYARNIIVSIDHWLEGWIDWNIVLDSHGGPNHVGNFCGAPIMINRENQEVYYTPVYHVLSQLSRTIRPGDYALRTEKQLPGFGADALHTCATINSENLLSVQFLNTTDKEIEINLQITDQYAPLTIPANAVQTVRVQL